MLTLLLCTATTFPGRLIDAVEGDAVCHVALDLGDGYAVAEEPCGLWCRPRAQYGMQVQEWALPLTESQQALVRQWLLARVGSAYDYRVIVDDAIRLLTHVELHLESPAGSRSYDCSGVIAAACAAAGWQPFGERDPRTVTPADWDRLRSSRQERAA
ncbi:MAG: hypothetical protein M1118_10975 [Chloroflexi bacterium]|nr:hypothetical protein [Chloroflexota bacterium]